MAKNLSVVFNAIDNISNRLGAIASSGRTVESSFQNMERGLNISFGSIERGSDVISQSFERTSESAVSLASNVGAYGGEAANAAGSANSLASSSSSAETSLIEAANAAEDAAGEIEDMGEQAEQAGDSSEEFGERSARAMDNLNSMLVSGGLVAAFHKLEEAFAECAAQAEVVETSIAQLQTIAGGDSIHMLGDDIMALSNETGQAAEGLADTAYNAISAGTAVKESVDAADQANHLAVAGFTDTSSALSVLETAMNSYGEAAGGMEHVSDSLITVQNLGVTTVAQLAAQMGKAISTASAYNVSLENLESGYISVTKAGISTAEGTTYLSSMLNELGNSGSVISKLLKDETGNTFGELMNEGRSLADVLGLVYDACDNNAEAMMNMWGSAEAGKAANAIIGQGLDKFNENLTTLREGTGTTAEAYAIMAGTTAYAHNKMDNAMKNTSVQIGEVLNPTLTKLYAWIEEIATGMGTFVEENPAVVKAIAAIGVGLGAVAAASAVATVAQMALNSAMLGSPLVWLIGATAALTAGILMLGESYEKATDASDELTLASQEQQEELNRLRKEYDRAIEKHGVGSKEASELALEIRQLEQAYGEAGETIGEFHQRIEDLSESLSNIDETYSENMKSAEDLYGSSIMLIGQLQALQNQTSLTDQELILMKQIVSELNGSYSDLGLSINETTGKTNFSISDLYDYAQAQQEQQKMEAASKGLVDVLGKYNEAKAEYEEAGKEVAGRQDKYEEMEKAWISDHPVLSQLAKGAEVNWSSDLGKQFDAWQKAQDDYKAVSDNYEKVNEKIREYCGQLGYGTEETEKFIEKLESGAASAGNAASKFGETGEELVSYEDAVTGAVNSSQEKLEKLAKSYDDAYKAAVESIEGQYSLWDKVDKKVLEAKTSVDKMGKALDSQIQYWDNYAKNLSNLEGRDVKGLGKVLKQMDDGSEESAAALAGMAKASDKELEKIVEKYRKLQKVQGKTADKVADLESHFASKCKKMSDDLKESVEKMNMEHDAERAAKRTIQAYINAIRSGVNGAKSAADAVADATAKALKTPDRKTVKPSSAPEKKLPELPEFYLPAPKTIQANAKGTTDSDTVYVAGEEGPELILSGGGDTVFPTSETNRIISAVSEENDNRQITEPSLMSRSEVIKSEGYDEPAGSDRTLTIKLEGGGTVSVGPGSSKEGIWNGTKGKIKSVFMQILKEEVFEEGAGAYDF